MTRSRTFFQSTAAGVFALAPLHVQAELLSGNGYLRGGKTSVDLSVGGRSGVDAYADVNLGGGSGGLGARIASLPLLC